MLVLGFVSSGFFTLAPDGFPYKVAIWAGVACSRFFGSYGVSSPLAEEHHAGLLYWARTA